MSRAPEPSAAPRRLSRAEAVLRARVRSLCIVLEDAHDPHNTSAVLRTCEAFGIQDVHLVAEAQSESILNPKVTVGAHRWLTVHRHRGAKTAIAALRRAGCEIYVSHLDPGATPLPEIEPTRRAAYVFGNERSGVTAQWFDAADATFCIPTSGFGGSLNLSVAVALTIYDRLLGQRGAQLPAGDLSDDERDALRAEWFAALAGDDPVRQREYAAFSARGVTPRAAFGADRRRRAAPEAGPA